MDHLNTARPVRNLAVDFYRVSGVVLIVLGHWLAGSVTYHDGHFGRENPLVDMPWTQWLTWIFQAVPVFFLAAGYAGAVSWTHRRGRRGLLARGLASASTGPGARTDSGVHRAGVGSGGNSGRLRRARLGAGIRGLGGGDAPVVPRRLRGGGVADADCDCRTARWGLLVPAVLAVGVAVLDVATIVGHVPYVGWLNYFLCWGALYQLGIAWHGGLLAGRRPVLLAAGSGVALALLIWLGRYPVSMIGVPGQAVQNTTPPTVAMLAFACAQAGLVVALAPALNRVLRAGFVKRVLSVANNNVMALYLWHMIPVVIVAIVAYPAGLLPQPSEGTGGVVAGSAGVGGHPQPGDRGRDGAVVVAATRFRRTAAHARRTADGSLGRSRHVGRCRDGRL